VRAGRILLVDDDIQSLRSTKKILELAGYAVVTAGDGAHALAALKESEDAPFDVVLTDVRMPRLDGIGLLRALGAGRSPIPVILMTAFGRVDEAVWAMKAAAVDFLLKPFRRQALLDALAAALARARSGRIAGGHGLIGSSEGMEKVRRLVATVARSDASVLLSGESGTGKERVAAAIHASSPRAQGPFVALNCAAIPDALIESELFGYEKGAFSGADAARAGLFEAAHGGTLLLDEVGDMPFLLQSKLLRSLQEGEVRRLGSIRPIQVDVRVISATHRDLREEVRLGRFREDLLFRLEVIGIEIPPLRRRLEDLEPLASHFLAEAAARHGKAVSALSPEAVVRLSRHSWPGNIRELANALERAVILCEGEVIGADDLPPHLALDPSAPPAPPSDAVAIPIGTPLKEVEDLLIRRTLEATDGDKERTARLLGVHSRTIYRKLKESPPGEPGSGGPGRIEKPTE